MMVLERSIIETHDDYSLWRDINAGFDEDKNFVVEMGYVNYDDRESGGKTIAVVNCKEAYHLAHRNGVKLVELPELIENKFGDSTGTALPSHVKEVFGRILDFISSSGIRYTLKDIR